MGLLRDCHVAFLSTCNDQKQSHSRWICSFHEASAHQLERRSGLVLFPWKAWHFSRFQQKKTSQTPNHGWLDISIPGVFFKHPSKQLAHRDDSSTVHSFQHFPGRGGRGQRVRITIGQWENDLLAFHVGNFREWFQSSLVLIIISSMFTSNVIIHHQWMIHNTKH